MIGRRTPEAVRAFRLPERRLAWGVTDDGTVLTATASALYDGEDPLPWTAIERVSWQPPVLTLVEASDVEGSGPRRSYALASDGRLAELVRARVTSSVGWTDRRRLRRRVFRLGHTSSIYHTSSARMQRARCPGSAISRRSGSFSRHAGMTIGQRSAKRHPRGRFRRSGTRPSIVGRRGRFGRVSGA